MNLQNNLKRFLSGILSVSITVAMLPSFPAFAEETVERYPYTMFAASDEEGAITINSSNFCVNGNIATNGTIVTSSQNFNINGTCVENANESMIQKINALYDSFFESANVIRVDGAYDIEEVNVNINKPVETSGNIAINGNINMTEGVMAVTDIEIDGNILNTNNSIICSRKGDINISSDNINLNGLIYAPYGDIFIDTSSLNMNSVIIIGQTITINCNNINACQSSHYATIIGNAEDDITTDPVKPTEPTQTTESTEHIETTTVSENITEPLTSVTTTSTVENENTDTSTVSTVTTTVSSDITTVSTSAESSQPTITTSSNNKSEIFVYGTYDEETNSVDIKWETEEDVKKFNILTSVDGESYEVHATVDNVDEYLYVIEDGTVEVYIKVSFKNEEGDMVESDHFVISKAENGYQIIYRDSDEDGICDIYEQLLGTDINNKDTDKDTLTDYEEIYITGTDPTLYDSVVEGVSDADVDCDEDNISNIEEIKIGTNPQMADSDLDELNDYEEINEYLTYPTDEDSDDDGLKDGTEIKLGLDPNNPETFGMIDYEYQIEQNLSKDNDVFYSINNENSPYNMSIDIITNNDIEKNIVISESNLSNSIKNDSILGQSVEIEITENCSPSDLTINFAIKEAYVNNVQDIHSEIEQFKGINRFAVFKYFEEVNAILPLYTKYDNSTNTISADIEDGGTYCVVDTEIWLNSLGINPEDVDANSQNTVFNIKKSAVNILADKIPTKKIGKGASGNFFENKPVDLVFAIQNCGIGDDAKIKFEFEKRLIRDLSNYAFNKYGNVRIHIVAYDLQWDNSNILTDGSSVFFDIKAVEKALDSIEYNDKIIGSANRALGHYLAFTNCKYSYRRDTTWFVYNLTNSSTYFLDAYGNYSYDFQSVYDYFWHNGMYYSQVIDGGNNFDATLKNLIYNDFTGITDSTAISYIKGKVGVDLKLDLSNKSNYNSLVNNLDMNVNPKSLYGAYSSIDWTKKILGAELAEDKPFDTDKDGVLDWDELDTTKLKIYDDGSFDLPTISDFVNWVSSDKYRESIFSYLNGEFYTDVLTVPVLPVVSDPTEKDSDKDGYTDMEDPKPYESPEFLGDEYDFLDNEIYIIKALDTTKNLVLDIDEYLVESGDQVIMKEFDEEDTNQKFKFEWCENGYKICPLEPLHGEDLVLSVSLNDDGTGNVSIEKDYNFDEQLWEVVPYVNKNKDRMINNDYGLIIRSKKEYYNAETKMYESLYLNYSDTNVKVTTERAYGTRLKFQNIVDDWQRFGSIYTDVVGWTDYPYNKDKNRAMKNYENNLQIGLSENNIYIDLDINLEMVLNQGDKKGGNFSKLTLADSKMTDVACEVIGTYNALCMANENNKDVDFFKLSSEFELNALIFNPVQYVKDGMPCITQAMINSIFDEFLVKHGETGGLGSDPRKIKYCLEAYNMNYKVIDMGRTILNTTIEAATQHESQCNKTELEFKENGAKSGIISYTYYLLNIHTFALRYDSDNKDNISIKNYNNDCFDVKRTDAASIISCFASKEYFYVGYILY